MKICRYAKLKHQSFSLPAFLFIFAFVLFFAPGCQPKKQDAAPQKIELVVPVQVAKVIQKPIDIKLDIVGTFESLVEIPLAAQVSGRVQQVMVDMGDPVRKGQVVVSLDPVDLKLALDLDKANLQEELAKMGIKTLGERIRPDAEMPSVKKAQAVMDNAYRNWQRNVKMREQDLVSQKTLEDSLKDYKTAKADYESALDIVSQTRASIESKVATLNIDQQKLKYTAIISPTNGYVKEKKVNPGDYVQVGGTVLTLVENDPVYLTVAIPQNFIDRIQEGKEIVLKTDAIPGKAFKGKIYQISPVLDPESRTIKVKAILGNPENLLKPGIFGKVSLIIGVDRQALLVPNGALMDEVGVAKVFVIRKEGDSFKAYARPVTKGQFLEEMTQVKGDLHGGDLVAVSNMAALVDGVLVKVLNASITPGNSGR
ncbi:MAG: efflux RND transporter periplasmic adaptor subunit [bacterium]